MFDNFRKKVILGLVLILGSIAAFGAAFYFFSRSLSAVAQDAASDRALILRNTELLANLAMLKRDESEAARYSKAMEKLLVTKDQLINFHSWLSDLGRTRQVDVNSSFSSSEVAPQKDYPGYINFSLDITGTLDAVTSFLADIEMHSPRFLVNLDSFDVSLTDVGYRIISRGKVFFK